MGQATVRRTLFWAASRTFNSRPLSATWATANGASQATFRTISKCPPRLTLNLGLRYEYDQPWYEQNNKTANVLPGGTVEYAGHVPVGAVAGLDCLPHPRLL